MGRTLVLGPVVVLALALGACGTSSEVDASKGDKSSDQGDTEQVSGIDSTTTTTTPAVTADPPLAFDAGAAVALPPTALQSNLAGDVTSRFTTLRGRTAFIVEPAHLRAVDVLTGEELWEAAVEGEPADPDAQAGPIVNDAGPRPPLVSSDGETVVAAVPISEPGKGTTPGHEAISVLAVDSGTGKQLWTAKVAVSAEIAGYGDGANTEVVAVTDEAVVVTYSTGDNILESATTAAIDPSTQETLWQRDEYRANALVAGDIVVGSNSNVPENTSMLELVAVDLTTGDERWLAARQSSDVRAIAAGDLVVVNHTDYNSGESALLLLDAATGQVRATAPEETSVGHIASTTCFYDERSIVVCTNFDAVTAYAADGKELWSLPDEAANRVAPGITTVWHGALYGETENGPVVLDAETGDDLSTDPGLAPYWVSEYAGIGLSDDGTPMAYAVKEN